MRCPQRICVRVGVAIAVDLRWGQRTLQPRNCLGALFNRRADLVAPFGPRAIVIADVV